MRRGGVRIPAVLVRRSVALAFRASEIAAVKKTKRIDLVEAADFLSSALTLYANLPGMCVSKTDRKATVRHKCLIMAETLRASLPPRWRTSVATIPACLCLGSQIVQPKG